MTDNHKSIDSFFESARNFKTPVSEDYARNLIGNSVLNSNKQKFEVKNRLQSFFSKKGVKTMTIISSLLTAFLISAISSGVFDNPVNTKSFNQVQNQTSIKQLQTNNAEQKPAINNPKKENSNTITAINSGVKSENSSNTDEIVNALKSDNSAISGMRKLKLTNEELLYLGISSNSDKDSLNNDLPYVEFADQMNDKMIEINKFYRKFSQHEFRDLTTIQDKVKLLKVLPAFVTDFDGTKRMFTYLPGESDKTIEEFMTFHSNLQSIYRLEFAEKFLPEKVPDDINNTFHELLPLINTYLSSKSGNKDVGKIIDNKVSELYDYYHKIMIKSIDESGTHLTTADSNISTVLEEFVENPNDTSWSEHIRTMAKSGIKVVLSKPRMSFKLYLLKYYPELEKNLTALNKQAENYIMVSKMLAIEVPYKNDANNEGLIFWFTPSTQLLDLLPTRYSRPLSVEFNLLESKVAICGAPIDADSAYLDIWRTCNGSIENLRIFPNPVKDILNIKFELNDSRDIGFAIHDISGKKIIDLEEGKNFSPGSNEYVFNLSNLQKGIYLFVVHSNNGEKVVQRLIKQ